MKQISDQAYQRFQAMCTAAGINGPEQQGLPVKEKWTPPEQPYWFEANGNVEPTSGHYYAEYGKERSTKSLCKIASDRTIRANRISAWLDSEGSGEQKHTKGESNYYVYKISGLWGVNYTNDNFYLDRVYMLEEDAIKLCEALNDGSFEL